MNEKLAIKLLGDAADILENMDVEYFLIDGTLLGAIRENKFIEYDLDMDLGVYATQWTPDTVGLLAKFCLEKKILLHHMFGDFSTCFQITLRRDNIKLDLFFYRRDGEFMILHAFKNGGRTLPNDIITYEYPKELIENLSTRFFYGRSFPIPRNASMVLEAKYGPEWLTPVKKWDWMYDSHNVRR